MLATARDALRKSALACAVSVLLLAPASSYALELGEATMMSGLGQSLLVEIPYRLASGERLTPACISLVPALRPAGALPTYTRASRVSITPTHIEIFGDSRVLEPLIGLNVDVRCASTPRLVRSYELFVDPPVRLPGAPTNGVQFASAAAAPASDAALPVARVTDARSAVAPQPRAAAATSGAPASAEASATARTANASARARGQSGGTLEQGQTYVVVRGDTLSGIAARISERPTIREAAEAIFAANPGAFTRGNRDLIEAGRSLTIPLMTAAAVAAPTTPAAAAMPSAGAVREAAPATALPPADVAPAASLEAPALPVPATSAVVPATAEPPAAPVAVAEPSAAPAQAATSATPANASPAMPAARTSIWLTVLLALGAAIALATPVLFLRRRKPEPAAPAAAKARAARPRQLIDPVAGFDVVEGEMPRTPTVKIEKIVAPKRADATASTARAASPTGPDVHALNIGPTDSVDLDVGTPTMVDPRVDWFGDQADAAAATLATPAVVPAAIETAATARMPQLDRTATVRQLPVEPAADVTDPTLNDQAHTLTVVELDILRQDYEAEHTLTQHGNQELREALADLKATQAAHAAGGDTATLEIPQQAPSDEELESQPTQKLRSSR